MIIEEPATNISKINKFPDYKTYSINCDCQEPEHSVICVIEKEHKYVDVTMYVEGYVPFTSFKERVIIALKVLFTGVYKTEHSIVMKESVAKNFGSILLHDIELMSKNRE